jgi:hypothetical protein
MGRRRGARAGSSHTLRARKCKISGEKSRMSARRHFWVGYTPPVFAYVGETKEIRGWCSYAGEIKEMEEVARDWPTATADSLQSTGKSRGMTTWGCTPSFLRKSAQTAGRTRDSCDPENERVRKSLKTRRDECEKLVTRASEQRGEQDREGVLNWQSLAVRREWRGIVMYAVVPGRGYKDSYGVVRSGGRAGERLRVTGKV